MQNNVIVARAWARTAARARPYDIEAATAAWSFECVCLFSLLGLIVTTAALFGASPATAAAVTAALT